MRSLDLATELPGQSPPYGQHLIYQAEGTATGKSDVNVVALQASQQGSQDARKNKDRNFIFTWTITEIQNDLHIKAY